MDPSSFATAGCCGFDAFSSRGVPRWSGFMARSASATMPQSACSSTTGVRRTCASPFVHDLSGSASAGPCAAGVAHGSRPAASPVTAGNAPNVMSRSVMSPTRCWLRGCQLRALRNVFVFMISAAFQISSVGRTTNGCGVMMSRLVMSGPSSMMGPTSWYSGTPQAVSTRDVRVA